jgi:hypothetical protein
MTRLFCCLIIGLTFSLQAFINMDPGQEETDQTVKTYEEQRKLEEEEEEELLGGGPGDEDGDPAAVNPSLLDVSMDDLASANANEGAKQPNPTTGGQSSNPSRGEGDHNPVGNVASVGGGGGNLARCQPLYQ